MNSSTIADIKAKILNIQQSLHDLEQLHVAHADFIAITPELEAKIVNIDQQLNQLESLEIAKITKIIQIRQRKRKKKKNKRQQLQKIKQSQVLNTTNEDSIEPIDVKPILLPKQEPAAATQSTSAEATSMKPHHYLRNSHNAQRFLRSFELLKILHFERGQNREQTMQFSQKLQRLSTVWNNIYHENQAERSQQQCQQDKWSQLLFGAPTKTYYHKTQTSLQELVNVRRTWDSYLTRSSRHGSCIPVGWITPPMKASTSWQQYLQNN